MNVTADSVARQEVVTVLRRLGLAGPGETPAMTALPGGVSSDIWRVDLPQGPVCVKRALPRLKVEALWEAPVERNAYERAWIEAVGDRVQIVGDDLLVTNAGRVRRAAERGAGNAVLLKPNQAWTLTEARAAHAAACEAGWGAILSARSGESEDVTIVHLAVGWGVRQLKVGAFSRSERMAKWNEALRIEEALGPEARLAGRGVFRTTGRG